MEPAIRKRAFADRAVTRTFRVKLTQIDTVVWTPEKTRHCRIDGSDCGEAKKELALRAETYGLAIDFLTAPSFHFGLRLHTQRGETLLDAPLEHRYPEESMRMFQAAHAAIDGACNGDKIWPLMQRPWHELARAHSLRILNARDNDGELHVGLLLLEDRARQPRLVVTHWFHMEGNDKSDHGVDHLYQNAFDAVVVLVRPKDFRRVLNQAHVLVAAFDAADARQLRGLLPRARGRCAAGDGSRRVVPTRFAPDRTYSSFAPTRCFCTSKEMRDRNGPHFTPRGKITWAARDVLSSRRVAYAASDAFAHLAYEATDADANRQANRGQAGDPVPASHRPYAMSCTVSSPCTCDMA